MAVRAIAAATFIDTNVLVYASRVKALFHQRAASALQGAVQADGKVWFSRQVLREYLAVVTRPQPAEPALSNAAANADAARLLATLIVAEDGPQVTAELMRLLAQHPSGGKQVHDANIVATMLAHGVPRLLTFNEADFRRFNALIEVVTP